LAKTTAGMPSAAAAATWAITLLACLRRSGVAGRPALHTTSPEPR
jgi:hypothetical protein